LVQYRPTRGNVDLLCADRLEEKIGGIDGLTSAYASSLRDGARNEAPQETASWGT
jgi:hypothetical protein